jgi:hypothetical protein
MTATAGPRGAKVSDDDLLAVVFQLGLRAGRASIRRALSARTGTRFRLDGIERRIRRLREARLLRLAPGRAGDDLYVRLTAAGVERLQSRQHEPLKPETD